MYAFYNYKKKKNETKKTTKQNQKKINPKNKT